MRRIKQQLPDAEALEILANAKRGVLSMTGDDGWPYGIWLNPHYRKEDGCIYFHGAKEGHKIDALRRDSRVSFTVIDAGVQDDGDIGTGERTSCWSIPDHRILLLPFHLPPSFFRLDAYAFAIMKRRGN